MTERRTVRSSGHATAWTIAALSMMATAPAALSAQKASPARDSCASLFPDLGTHPDGSPVLATVTGRILEPDGVTPAVGARLQIEGTTFGAFTDTKGEYHLAFDPKTLDRCHAHRIQVVAAGHKVQRLTLNVGPTVHAADFRLRKD